MLAVVWNEHTTFRIFSEHTRPHTQPNGPQPKMRAVVRNEHTVRPAGLANCWAGCLGGWAGLACGGRPMVCQTEIMNHHDWITAWVEELGWLG
jgi:hypothetical protein